MSPHAPITNFPARRRPSTPPTPSAIRSHRPPSTMSQFRAARLDLGSFINGRNIRDHTKRKVFAQFEPERYDRLRAWRSSSAQC